MPSFKLQIVKGEVPPEHFDFRGDGFRGAPTDNHRTVAEIEPCPQGLVDLMEASAAGVNVFLFRISQYAPSWLSSLASVFGLKGGAPYLQVRLFDH